MKKIDNYTLVKVSFESRELKSIFESVFIKMFIREDGSDDYIAITAYKNGRVAGMNARIDKRNGEYISMKNICLNEMVRSMQDNFKFDLMSYIK